MDDMLPPKCRFSCKRSGKLLLKHVRNWSYETLSREVRANLIYREFTRVADGVRLRIHIMKRCR